MTSYVKKTSDTQISLPVWKNFLTLQKKIIFVVPMTCPIEYEL